MDRKMSKSQSSNFSVSVQPIFEQYRAEFLEEARRIALRLGRRGKLITVNDVRAHISPPDDVDPRVMGAVFRTSDWERVDYVTTDRRACHGRPVARFRRIA